MHEQDHDITIWDLAESKMNVICSNFGSMGVALRSLAAGCRNVASLTCSVSCVMLFKPLP